MRLPLRVAAVTCAVVLSVVPATVSRATETAATQAAIAARLRELKRLQHEILVSKGEVRARAQRDRDTQRRRRPRTRAGGSRVGAPREAQETGWKRHRAVASVGLAQQDPLPRPTPARVSDPFADQLVSATQSEVTAVVVGRNLVAAWNDGEPVDNVPGLGFGYSTDGGRTWVDGGAVPRLGGVALWTSDPVLAVDEKAGCVYLGGLVTTTSSRNGVAIVRGDFQGGGLAWTSPVVVRATRDTFPDKLWLAADSSNGDVHVTYTTFFRVSNHNTDQIEHQRSTDGGTTWTPAQRLSVDDEQGLVQGSRPAIGPDGQVYAVWKTIDTTEARGGLDRIRIRTSLDRGVTFGAPSTVADVFTNFCSGPPGFNRGFGLGFPSIAVDRGTGPHRGRLYVAWEEPLNFYDDPLGTGGAVGETEPNPGPLHATPFALGDVVRGAIEPGRDVDWFRFQGVVGQTAVFHLDSMASELDVSLRLWCFDGGTALAYSAPVLIRPRVLVYTLPATGDYRVSIAPHDDSTGTYRLVTGIAWHGAERGRDHRDAFVTTSDDGQSWTEPVRINPGPPGYDAWVPEVAVAADGEAFALWYDWGDSDPGTCGSFSNPHVARSDDGGATWSGLGALARAPTDWTQVESNLSPNIGDYVAVTGDDRAVYAFWGDGGLGDPDVLMTTWLRSATAERVRPLPTTFPPAGPWVTWQSPDSLPIVGTLWRRTAWSDWLPLRSVRGDIAGVIGAIDATAERGVRYHYRLGISAIDGERTSEDVVVDVPESGAAALAIERLLANPARRSVRFWFHRAGTDDPALAELFDVAGRRRASRRLGPEYGLRGQVELGGDEQLPGGLYVIRLTQGGQTVGARVVLLP